MPNTMMTYKTADGGTIIGTPKQIANFILATAKQSVTVANKDAKPAVILRKGHELKKIFSSIMAPTAEEFVNKCMDATGGQGIHVVFSGLNELIKTKYGVNPRDVITVTTTVIGNKSYVEDIAVGDVHYSGHFSNGGLTISKRK